MEQILGMIPQADLLDIGFSVARPNDPLDGFFPDQRTDNLFAAWQSLAAQYQVPMMACYHAFDTEALQTIRTPVDTHNIEKGLIKVKINQSERVRALLRSGVREDALYDYVVNDAVRLADQVVTRTKAAKAELMATGQVTIDENNLNLSIHYGVPGNQVSYTLDLSPDADVPAQLQNIVDDASAIGVTLSGLVTARKNITKMRQNKAVQTSIMGNTGAGALVPRAAFDSYLETEYGISRIVTDDLNYATENGVDADGRPKITMHRYFPENKVSFFAANPAGTMGAGLWGDPPEVEIAGDYSVSTSSASPYVYVTQKYEWDPAVLWTKASGLFVPVLYNPNSLFIATVTAANP